MKNELCCYEKFTGFVNTLLERTAHFDLMDWAVLKTCLLSLGILIGALFARLFKKLAPLMAIIFIASWFYLLLRILFIQETE